MRESAFTVLSHLRTRPSPTRRWGIGALAATLLLPVLVIAPLVLAPAPAGAEGFNFLCGGPAGGGGGPSEFDQMANGLAVKILQDQAIWQFEGRVPAGVPVTAPGAVTDPVTGETTFSMPIRPKLGNSQRLDFIDGNVVPGAAGDEIRFGFGFRGRAGQSGDDLSMRDLFRENFGVAPDVGNDVSVAGVDINFDSNAVMGGMEGFRGRFSAFYTYKLADGTDNLAVGTFTIDSDGPGYRIPESAGLSLAIRKPPNSTSSFVAFGQRALHSEFTGAANQPGVGFGIDLTRAQLVPGDILFDPFLSMHLGWGAAPRSVAVGVGSLCPDKGQLAWNHDGLPNPAAGAVDVDVKYGIEEGQKISVDDGSGPHNVLADTMDVEGRIDGLPSQMDVILLRNALSFTRSPDVAPDLDLTRLSMADDSTDPEARPTFATAKVTDLPRHILVTTEDAPDGSFARGELTSWTLACPGEPPPGGPAAPTPLRRLDLPQTLPGFPVGCVRHALTPIPSAQAVVQNWLPEDLNAQAGTAGLATPPTSATQFGYVAVRDSVPLGSMARQNFRAFGGKLNGVQRVTVDVTSAAADEDQVRAYIERAPAASADDSFRMVAEVDTRNSPDELTNTGSRIAANALVVDLPDKIRLDYRTDPDTPLEVSWRTDTRIAIADGSFEAQGPAPDAMLVHGAFETNAGALAAPPTATLQVTDKPNDGGGTVSWTAPAAPTDGFPSPPAPPAGPAVMTRVHAGAQVSTRAERDAGLATRLHADVTVGQPIIVDWVNTNALLASLDAALCTPGSPTCASNRFDVTVAKNVEGPVTGANLLVAPALPEPEPTIAAAVQPFTDFRPSTDGVRAVNITRDHWGADLLVHGLEHLAYKGSPVDVAVETANPTPRPVVLNFLDTTKFAGSRLFPRAQVLFADAVVDRMPSDVRVKLQGPEAAADEPLVWVNTEDVTIDDLDTVDWTHDSPAGRPTLTGVVRYGDAALLRTEVPAAARPHPRPAGAQGVDVWADYAIDSKLVAVDVAATLPVPRHTAIYRPDLTRCDETSPDANLCRPRPFKPVYEMDSIETVRAELLASIATLGQLNVLADIHGSGLDWTLRSQIANLPGTIVGLLTITDNMRLPWLQVDAALHGSDNFGGVRVEVFDHNNPTEYRQAPDVPGQRQCQDPGDICTANYAVVLTGVGSDLEVTGRVRGSAEARITPAPDEPPPPGEPETSVGGTAYVHAQVDLLGLAEKLVVEGREGGDGQFVGSIQAFGSGGFLAPVTGFLNARVDHVQVDLDSSQAGDDPFNAFVFDKGGIVGLIASKLGSDHGATIGHVFQYLIFPLAVLDGVIGVVLDLLYDGTVRTQFDLDLDLPLWVAFDRVDTMRVGMSGPVLSVDERHPSGGGPAEIGTLQFSMAHEVPLQVNGAFVHHRVTNFTFDAVAESFDIDNEVTDQLADIGLYRHADCEDHDEDDTCYSDLGPNAVHLNDVTALAPREAGFASADILVDLFFDEANRDEMSDENDGIVEPGVVFYEKLAENSDPVVATDFFIPELDPGGAAVPRVFTTSSYCCSSTTFTEIGGGGPGQPPPPPPVVRNFGAVCDASTPDQVNNGPRAVGTDGTVYVVLRARSSSVNKNTEWTLCNATRFVLEAHFPANPATPGELGPVRWTIALPTPLGLGPSGQCRAAGVRCDFITSVDPRPDGSVQVQTFTLVVTGGVDDDSLDMEQTVAFQLNSHQQDLVELFRLFPEPELQAGDGGILIGGTKAWVDASGHPGFHVTTDAQVPAFTVVTQTGTAAGAATLNPCAIAPTFGCAPLPAGHKVQWLFGDGTMSGRLGAAGATAHQYPHTAGLDQFLGVLVHLDAQGRLVEKAYFRLAF